MRTMPETTTHTQTDAPTHELETEQFRNADWAADRIQATNAEPGMGFTLNSDLTEWDTAEGGYIVTVTMQNVQELTKQDILAFYTRYESLIKKYGLKLGAFNLENADGVDIDLNVRVEDKDRAVELGQQFNQESVFDANTFDLIHTGGRGDKTVETPAEVRQAVTEAL